MTTLGLPLKWPARRKEIPMAEGNGIAIGMIETKGLCALFEATDAALKAADVSFSGWEK